MNSIKNINDWEVLTPSGWSNFKSISKLQKKCYIKIIFTDTTILECSENHRVKLISGEFIYAKDLRSKMELISKNGSKTIKSKRKINKLVDLYDLNNVEKNLEFYSNDIISHNCALIEEASELWTSALPTISTGGNAILLSCVTQNTMVITPQGIKEIENYIDISKSGGYEIKKYGVMGVNGIRYGHLFHNNGLQKTNIIKTKFSELECTGNHKLWAYKKNENKFGWYESSKLEIGDYLSIQYGQQVWGNKNDVIGFKPSISSKIHSPFYSDKLTPDLCYLFGLYISEGSSYKVLNNNKDLIGGNLTITCGDNISWIFDKLNLIYYCHDGIHYTVSNKNFIEFMEYVGFDLSNKANKKCIPKQLLCMDEENTRWLLRGIFDGDGSGTNKVVKLTSTSKKLIDQVRMLLLNFGILATVYHEPNEIANARKGKIKHNCDGYNLEIYGRYVLRYYNVVGFGLERKQKQQITYLLKNLDRSCSKDIIPNTSDLVKTLIKTSGYLCNDIKRLYGISVRSYCLQKTDYKTKNISRDNVVYLYSLFSHNLSLEDREYWNNIINENVAWCEIKSIIPSENETFDFSLPDDINDFWCHSVIYNGVIGHNTPRGVGNFFHKMWQGAEENSDGKVGQNGFHPINLPWQLHPERNEEWRRIEGEKLGNPKRASQEFDCSFLASGDNVIDLPIIEFYKKNKAKDPMEITGIDRCLWIWSYPVTTHSYVVSADVARGDGADFSACHVLDITLETPTQVAEYRGSLGTKDFGNFLVELSTKYNDALLIVERENVGWATLQQVIDRGYKNTFYSSTDLKYVDVQRQLTNRYDSEDRKLVPGFSTNMKTRPLVINNLELYFRNMAIDIYSKRLLAELETFIWKNGKAIAMDDYHDDLVISLGIGLWVRDTAMRLRLEGMDLTRETIGNISMTKMDQTPFFKTRLVQAGAETWSQKTGKQGFGKEVQTDLRWLL